MFPVLRFLGLPGTTAVRLRPASAALAFTCAMLAVVPTAAQSNEATVSFEHAEYSVPEGYFPEGSISYAQVNVFLSAAPNTFRGGTFDLDYAGRLVVPLTREMVGGATHGVDFYGASASVRFEPDETTAFLRIFPQADDEDEVGEGVTIGFGTAPKGVRIGTPNTATVMFDGTRHAGGHHEPVAGHDLRERRRQHGVGMARPCGAPRRDGDGAGGDGRLVVARRLRPERGPHADDCRRFEVEHRHGDGHGGGQPRGRTGPEAGLGARLGVGPGGRDRRQRAVAVHSGRRHHRRDSGADAALDLRERRREYGDGDPERHGQRRRDGDGGGRAGRARGCQRLHPERHDADDRGGWDVEHRHRDDHGPRRQPVRAEDGDGDRHPDRVHGRGGSGAADVDHHRRRDRAGADAGAGSGVHLGERRRDDGDGVAGPAVERAGDADGLGDAGVSRGDKRLRAECEYRADHPGPPDREHGDGDGRGGGQRRRRAEQDGDGVGGGDRRAGGVDGSGCADPGDHRRRRHADGDAGPQSGVDLGERRPDHGDRDAEPDLERDGDGDGDGDAGLSGRGDGLRADRDHADDRGGQYGQYGRGEDRGGGQRPRRPREESGWSGAPSPAATVPPLPHP